MYKIEDLLRMIPDGLWSLNEDCQIIDPKGNVIKIESRDLSPVEQKLYSELLTEFANRVPYLIYDLDVEQQRVAGLFKEVRHIKARIRESYNRGVTESAEILHNIKIHTPTARDALISASESMERLLDK